MYGFPFIVLDKKGFFHCSSGFTNNCDETSANCIETDLYTFVLQIHSAPRVAEICCSLSERISSVSWIGFCLTTTLLVAFRRNRASILFQLDDTTDSCKTHTNQCSNPSLRLGCVVVRSYGLRTFPGCHVQFARRLTIAQLIQEIRFLKSDATADDTVIPSANC